MKKNELKKWRENYSDYVGPCLAEGIRLNVHFEEKDCVKQIGAMWKPDSSGKGGYWWMPVNRLETKISNFCLSGNNIPAIVNIFDPDAMGEDVTESKKYGDYTVLEWLNLNKMVSGENHGDLVHDLCSTEAVKHQSTVYCLTDGVTNMFFEFFDTMDVVQMSTKDDHIGSDWSTTENARNVWNSLAESGWVRDDSRALQGG